MEIHAKTKIIILLVSYDQHLTNQPTIISYKKPCRILFIAREIVLEYLQLKIYYSH